jgi:hypothetical protein
VQKSPQIGQILIEQGILSEQQVFEILRVQQTRHLPFGVLAERMFEVTADCVEKAWIEQYQRFTGTIDLAAEKFNVQALKLINRRQAWQFQILPIRFESSGELLMAAERCRLARAVTFITNRLEPLVFFRIAESSQLRDFLLKFYPMPEVSEEMLRRARELAWASEDSTNAP